MPRLSDEQFAELEHYIPLTYMGGSWEDWPEWMAGHRDPETGAWKFGWVGPDGGVLALLDELRTERARTAELEARIARA